MLSGRGYVYGGRSGLGYDDRDSSGRGYDDRDSYGRGRRGSSGLGYMMEEVVVV